MSAEKSAQTPSPPMLQQYRQLKARYPDATLLFRLGDFYEMFEEDARLVSRQLGLVLTARRFAKGVRLPMAGIPYRQLTPFIAKLLALGHKVAVADQMETSSQVKGLLKREIVRVVTPGTVVEEALLTAKSQNFLAALAPADAIPGGERLRGWGWGLAAVDLATGEFVTAQFDGDQAWLQLQEELNVLQPSELLLPAGLLNPENPQVPDLDIRPDRLSGVEEAAFHPEQARRLLLAHLGARSLEPYGCEGLPLATAAAGAALFYLHANQLSDLAHLGNLETYHPEASLGLDPVTRRNLELTSTLRDGRTQGSLLGVLDRTVTAMGARLLRRWIQQPLLDLPTITQRLDAVEELSASHPSNLNPLSPIFLRSDLRKLLDGLYDMERIVGRIGFGTAHARDVAALGRTLKRIPQIKGLLSQSRSLRLQSLYQDLDELADVGREIGNALVADPPILLREGGLIRPSYSPELGQLHQEAQAGRAWLTEYEAQERERTGIPTLRVRYNQVFGFFVEVARSKSDLVPADYERRATISHAERFVTPALKERERGILAAEERANELEYELFVELRRTIAAHSDRLRRTARIVAELDVLATLAEVADHQNYVRPMVDDGATIQITQGRHPVVEQLLPDDARFVPNDILLQPTRRLLIITGPNMSGKSVLSRQTALTVLMAQMGAFVPAVSAHIGLADRLFVRAGASDDITQGRSTFLVEMSETAYILRHATARSLVVLDEVGRGTSTYDGMALAWAVGEDLHSRIGARTLFATHFHELIALADGLDGAVNVSLAVKEEGKAVLFLYRLQEEGADRSYGIQVARLAGVPEHVVEKARAVMAQLEGDGVTKWPAAEQPVALASEPPVVQDAARQIYHLDVANMTPVQALIFLNQLQQRLRTDLSEVE